MKWGNQFSPKLKPKPSIFQLNKANQRRVETALGHRNQKEASSQESFENSGVFSHNEQKIKGLRFTLFDFKSPKNHTHGF
jgi:hypothetical protein